MKIFLLLITISMLASAISFGQSATNATVHPDSVSFTFVGTVYADKIKKGWQIYNPIISINGGRAFTGDTNGRFIATVKKNDVLIVKGLGCEPKKITIRKRID